MSSSVANPFHFGNGSSHAQARRRPLAASGIRGENRLSARALRVLANPKPAGALAAIDRFLEDGTLDARQHAGALAYGALRRRYDRSEEPCQTNPCSIA